MRTMKSKYLKSILLYVISVAPALADSTILDMHSITADGIGDSIGTITIKRVSEGLKFDPRLKGLTPGVHGFHVHENGACGSGEKDGLIQAGLAAGSHYDPDKSGQHLGPYGMGHRGDLSMLDVSNDGTALMPITSNRLTLDELHGRSIIIHANSDDYQKQPGGPRIACGIVP